MFARLKNIFLTRKRDQALDELSSCYERFYCGDDMFIAERNMSFYDDAKFQDTMDKLAKGGPYPGMAWRMHVLIWAVKRALALEGDLCEFGTFRGFKMHFILAYFGSEIKDRKLYLFDTFEGIDPDQSNGSPIKPQEHQKTGLYDFVKHRFSEYKNVVITKGAAPQSIEKAPLNKISFVHLDMNSYQAEIGTLEKIWDRIADGGVIILDDFGLYSHRAQMEKELPWFAKKGYLPLELPTGQAIVIK